MANSTETSISNLKIHKVPNYETWAELYGQSNGIGTNELVIIPPNEIQPTIKGKGVLKGDGEGNISAAEPNVDFISPIAGEAKGKIVHFEDGVDNLPLSSLILDINPIQAGSGDPSPSNVRAISGWTGASVTRTGKNLLQINNITEGDHTYYGVPCNLTNGVLTFNGTATANNDIVLSIQTTTPYLLAKAGDYVLSGGDATLRLYARIRGGAANRYINSADEGGTTFTLAEGEYVDRVYVTVVNGTIYSATLRPMIRRAGNSADFEPYAGTTKSISFGQTVYGGKLNVTTGVLTVTHRYVTFLSLKTGNTDWTYDSTNNSWIFNVDCVPAGSAGEQINAWCPIYKVKPYGYNGTYPNDDYIFWAHTQGSLRIKDSRYGSNDTDAFRTMIHDVYVCLPLAVADQTSIQLTPTEVTTLLGENNIWADCGDIEIKYGENPNTRNEIQSIIENTNHFVEIENNSSIVHFEKGIDNFPLSSFICNINPVQAGSGDPSPSNIRELAGFTQVDLCCAGRNLLVDNKVYPITHSNITTDRNADGSYQITGSKTSSSAVIFLWNFAYPDGGSTTTQFDYKKWLQNGNYKAYIRAEGLPSGAVVRMQIYSYNSLGSTPSLTALTEAYTSDTDAKSFTVTADNPFVMCRLYFGTGTYSDLNATLYPMIYRADETDTSWDAPRSSKAISLGRTVYGGKLNVTTGELTVTHGYATFDGTESWGGPDEYGNIYLALSAAGKMTNRVSGELTSQLKFNLLGGGGKAAGEGFVSTGGYLDCKPTGISTAADWKTLLGTTNLQVVYPLATPITYQLTPTQVTSLLGENNIWTDCGDIISLKCLQNSNFYQEMQTVVDKSYYYGECSTAAATQAKTVTIANFPTTLTAGLSVRIKFTNAQTYAGTPTLQVNSTEAKSIYRSSTAGGQYMWFTGEVLDFVYDGINWVAVNDVAASTTYFGVTKLSSSTSSTSTSLAATPSAVKAAYDLANAKQSKITASGLLKGDGNGGITAAVADVDYIDPADLGLAGGVATLDGDGKITPDQLSSKIESVTASRDLATSDNCHTLLCSNSNVTLTIPNTITTSHFECEIIRWQSANTVTIAAGNNVKIAFSGGTTAYTSFKITDACESAILKRIMESSGNQYWLIQGKVEGIS